jgi:hypothetical protein
MKNEELFRSFREFQLAFAAVKIGLFHHLDQASHTCQDVSQALGLPAERVVRLLRGLVWAGLLVVDDQGKYALTDGARPLLDKSAIGAANGIRFQGEFFYRAWAGLPDFIATGITPFVSEHGCDVFELLQADPALAELYAAPMAHRSSQYSQHLVRHPAVAAARTIVDVGGGHGRLAVDLLSAIPTASGIIFDLEIMRRSAQETIQRHGVADRCRFEAGDMFREIPAGADVYILKWLLHDWDDQRALTILKHCAHAMHPNSKLLIVERLMPEQPAEAARSQLVMADLNMLCQGGGAERTLEQYRRLCATTGLSVVSCVPIEQTYGFHAIECAMSGLAT